MFSFSISYLFDHLTRNLSDKCTEININKTISIVIQQIHKITLISLAVISNLLNGKPKKYYIYLGNLDKDTTEDKVKNFLNLKLPQLETDENSSRDVNFDDLKELKTENTSKNYKSYSFSVNYLDKDIIKIKSLWPLYSIVNKYKLSLSEWTAISSKFKKNSLISATTSSVSNV